MSNVFFVVDEIEDNSRGKSTKRQYFNGFVLGVMFCLRILSECFILVGSAMFGATFNLVTRVGLP